MHHPRAPLCRGIVVPGFDAPLNDQAENFAVAETGPLCRGFAVGRLLFWDAAERWFEGAIGDRVTTPEITGNYRALVERW